MKFILILEDDARIRTDLYESLKSIDPRLHIRFFSDLASFHEFLKIAVHEGPKALANAGTRHEQDSTEEITPANTHELRLIIAKNEFLGVQNMGLIRRARDFFVRKHMCSEQEPTALILTAFDSPSFDIKLAEERIINNVIFKPFDKLILKQHLEYALTGHHPVTETAVATVKIQSTIEMLKEVSLHSLSEVGFTTINNHEIKIGAMTKYYSEAFASENKKSVYASCVSCKALSDKEFLCEFHFFAADSGQISKIRRHILENKKLTTLDIQNTGNTTPRRILLIDEDVPLSLEMKLLLTERFNHVEVFSYNNMGQLLSDLADKDTPNRQQLPTQFDFVFADYALFEIEKEKRWAQICDYLKDRAKLHGKDLNDLPELFLHSRRKLPPNEIRKLSTWARDVFFTPLEKSYIVKKLISDFGFANKSPAALASIEEPTPLKVANPVDIIQISEAGLVMKYYRAISTGAFREFILWRPEEDATPEIIGTVNFHEENKSDEGYLNHFVFFGMKDHYLKHIRLWLLDAYIKSKDGE